MSKKINAEKHIENTNLPPQNSSNEPQGDTFSFLELNKFLENENKEREHIKSKNKQAKKRSSYEKGESEEKHKLKIKPNLSIAREQTSDDMMYIENDDLNQKEEVEKEEKKEIKETNKEKIIPKKQEEKKKAKVDKRLVKLNLNKEKSEEKLKNKEKDLNSDKKDKKSKEEKTEIYGIESFINKIKENDPQAYTPIMLPLEKDNTEEKSLKDELMEENEENKNKLFVFQFPRQIPIKDLNNQIKTKEEENVNEEPEYDQNGFLISPEFKNSFQEIKNNTVIGKLVIMKSGKLKIKMGDIYFDVNQGCLTKFAQFAVITENKDNQAYILGQPLNKKLIVTPEFD